MNLQLDANGVTVLMDAHVAQTLGALTAPVQCESPNGQDITDMTAGGSNELLYIFCYNYSKTIIVTIIVTIIIKTNPKKLN
jgi:hypothetical protein